jgi:hypothetical protein
MGQTALHLCTPDAPARKVRRGDARRQADRDLLLELASVKQRVDELQRAARETEQKHQRIGERVMLLKIQRFCRQRNHHDAIEDILENADRLLESERVFA